MVIIPDSAAVADGLSFTVSQITWTIGVNSFTAAATEEVQIRSASTTSSSATALTTLATALTTPATAPTTLISHRPLPCYKGRTIDNTDLMEAIDQVGLKLSETMALVDTTSPQQIYPTSSDSPPNIVQYRSCGHRYSPRTYGTPSPGLRLSEYQVLTEDREALPYGLKNVASEYAYRTPHLFVGPMERDHVSHLYFLDIPRPPPGNAVNMVDIREHNEGSVHTLPEEGESSTRSTCSVHTEAEHLDHDKYDLDPLPHPLGFSPIPRFPPRHGDTVLNVSNDEPLVAGETDKQRQLHEQRNTKEEAHHWGPRP
jgi:hypothetical protein